ncbi:SGNH/GDSL hydrolase family protein [Kribbella sp.]|uniref:SGNH/GDSL hydrolase family protein n=1 Tax=Kribbella sp. TaxID=1871183 RepID=UPI002D6DF93B|nr:SGNH/GDSL hydrolase family protein [Kribbella sp.]HZX07804.1 SGNH/GDSL hydrolase family protein [Kribbella sp.]
MTTLPADALLRLAEPLTWVFTGDSVTQGARHTNGWRDYTELFAERWRWELRRRRDLVVNTGISDRRIGDLAGDLEHCVLRHRPEVVVLMFALNDATLGTDGLSSFADGYTEVLRRLTGESDAVLVVQTPNQVARYDEPRRTVLPEYAAVVRELADRFGAVLVDHHRVWTEAGERTEYWISEGCHPNEYGHRMLASELFRTLGVDAPESSLSRSYLP